LVNKKSDVPAKKAFVEHLKKKGFDGVKVISSPSDIIAYKNGEKHYFEIKYTARKKDYFGEATLTEWEAAFKRKQFRFVIAKKTNEHFEFEEFTPEDFLQYSTIPPAKIFFNIKLNKLERKKHEIKYRIPKNRSRRAIKASKEKIDYLIKKFQELKEMD
tara:strand:+ start:481 stop:957 length:477 start_codon:yes stop_codon:yes gene_type:complete